jgi:predicted pyridoxine 5'-phosphate oxidase superfamily flavin-nucleotide-binding protein
VGALFHEGERAVQRRAGVERVAAQVGRNILSFVPPAFAAFLSRQPFVVVASQDEHGRVWASLIAGGAGFAAPSATGRYCWPACQPPGTRLNAPLTGRQRRPARWRSSSVLGSGSA